MMRRVRSARCPELDATSPVRDEWCRLDAPRRADLWISASARALILSTTLM